MKSRSRGDHWKSIIIFLRIIPTQTTLLSSGCPVNQDLDTWIQFIMFRAASYNHVPNIKLVLLLVLMIHGLTTSGAEAPCPDEAAIAPCVCYTADGDPNYNTMDCSDVETEEQIQNAFLADFPTRVFRTFYMNYNSNLTRLGDVMQGTTFQIVYLWNVVVEVITEDCFIASVDTLESLAIDGSMLNTSSFPFDTIGNYSRLTLLDVANSRLDTFPELRSESVTDVWFPGNEMVGVLPASALRNLPNLTEFHVYYNYISEIEPGAFNALPLLKTVSMFGNLVSVIRSGTFVVASHVSIGITTNTITAVEPGAFSKVNNADASMSISLSSNFITEIVEYVWADVLQYNDTYLSLSGNPLSCGCDVAWLLDNSTGFLDQMDSFTACEDGRLLYDLDPAEYGHC